MFNSSSMGTSHEGGGVAGPVLIPMRFVWPYGGTNVCLGGSFNGWTQLLPMSPVDGCPLIFQVIWSITPGFHQFKFFVDGQWRHDEHQPHTTSPDFGTVNTVFLAVKPNNYIDGLNPETHTRSTNMDEDGQENNGFRRMIRVPDGILTEATPRITEADRQVSRYRFCVVMSTRTVYDSLPTFCNVTMFDVGLPVKQAFHILHEQGLYMAPLWDSRKQQCVGVLSASDFMLILRELGNHGSNLTEEQLETHTIAAWKEGKAYLKRQIDGHGRAFLKPLIHASPLDSLKDMALKILQHNVSTVPIFDGPTLMHVHSLSGVLQEICRYFRHCSNSLPILQQPICEIPVGTWVPRIGDADQRPFAMLRPTASLGAALNLLLEAQVSSIPIVDDNGSLLDIYCRSDITALAKDRVYARINLNRMNIQQALQLGLDSYSPYEPRSQRCQMCLRTDSLHRVMERLAKPGVRRLVIVEAGSKRVEGIVSVGDIFRFFLG